MLIIKLKKNELKRIKALANLIILLIMILISHLQKNLVRTIINFIKILASNLMMRANPGYLQKICIKMKMKITFVNLLKMKMNISLIINEMSLMSQNRHKEIILFKKFMILLQQRNKSFLFNL